MATARKETITIETVHLDLSIQEASTLRGILDRVGGDSDNSLRKYADNINYELEKIGIYSVDNRVYDKEENHPINSIFFKDNSLQSVE
jgi:hypothetical protein